MILDLSKSFNSYKAKFYNGQSAVAHHATIIATSDSLEIITHAPENTYHWRYDSIRVVQPPRDDVPAQLACVGHTDAQLFLTKEVFTQLTAYLPKQKLNHQYIGMIVSFILVITITAFWLIPAAAPVVARAVPISWEKRLGNLVYKQLIGERRVCLDKNINQIMDKVAKKLAVEKNPVPIKISIVQSEISNAYALPANQIIIHSQLIADAKGPEELVGVIAHEIGHIANNHVMENVVRYLGMGGLVDVATGGGGTVIYFITELYNTAYGRDKEREADEFAAKIMTSRGYKLNGIIDFFSRKMREEKLAKKSRSNLLELQWLSTHPATHERISFFKKYPKPIQHNAPMTDAEWKSIKNLKGCLFFRP